MSEDNRRLVERAYEAFGRGDVAAVMEAFDEQIDWNTPEVLPHAMQVKGRDAVGGFFEKLASEWDPGFGIEIDDICASGDRVCAIGKAAGHLDGTPASYGFVHAWTIRDGLCVRFDEYVDPSAELIRRAAAQTV
jgi:ketosteroid isomerase-like protein